MIGKIEANKDKDLVISLNDVDYARYPIKTHVIKKEDNIENILNTYVTELYEDDDVVFIAESIIAIIQQRVMRIDEIEPSLAAKVLCKFVYNNPRSVGLTIPETMEMAIQEVGTFKILVASVASAFGKLIGKRGIFYKITGPKVRDIDGPDAWTLPPYNECVVLGPKDPQKVAEELTKRTGMQIAIVDINDLGGNILGSTAKSLSKSEIASILKDNPLGQTHEQTPIGIIRKMS